MIIRSSIQSFPSMREAYVSLLSLESKFLEQNKRKNIIDLTLTSTSKPIYDGRGKLRFSKETIEIRAVYDNEIPEQVFEYKWFLAQSQII